MVNKNSNSSSSSNSTNMTPSSPLTPGNMANKKVASDQLKSCNWTQLAPMHAQREGGAAVAIPNNRILVVGGYHVEKKFLKSCAVLDLNTQTWADFPPMRTARMGCAAVFLQQHNAVVVVGGFQRGRKYLATAEYLDLSTLQWHRLPQMQVPRAGCAAVTVAGKRVVVLGGWKNGETAVSTAEVFDFSAQQWHYLPEMPSPRAGCTAAAVGYRVLVLGGHTTTGKQRGCRSSVEVLDLTNQTWGRMPSMRSKRDASACCVVGNSVLVLGGGETSTMPLSSVEMLDVGSGSSAQWKEIPSMKSKRFGCSAAAVGNRIVVFGGRGSDGKHLETVEMLKLPLTDEIAVSNNSSTSNGGSPYQSGKGGLRRSASSDKLSVGLGSFLDNNRTVDAGDPAADWKSAAESLVGNVQSMMDLDKARIQKNYERNKAQAHDLFERSVSSYEDRLKAIEKEKHRLMEQIQKARKDRDESIAKADQEREEAMEQINTKMQPLLERAQQQFSSSAPERMIEGGDGNGSGNGNAAADELEPPSELLCCITGDLMDEPVTAMDGHTYEKSAIEAWYARFDSSQAPKSPMTNEPMPSRRLIPSHNIRSQCKTWKAKLKKPEEMPDPLANLTSSTSSSGGGGGTSSTSHHSSHNHSSGGRGSSLRRSGSHHNTSASEHRSRGTYGRERILRRSNSVEGIGRHSTSGTGGGSNSGGSGRPRQRGVRRESNDSGDTSRSNRRTERRTSNDQ